MMRSIEMLYVILNVLLLGWLVFGRNKSQRGLLIGGGISILFMLVHGIIEGMRWPMIPVYLLTVLSIDVGVRYFFKTKEQKSYEQKPSATHRIRLVLITTLAGLYAIVVVALPFLFPIFSFEKPTGPYKIGTMTYHWTDNTREEYFTEAPDDKRELMVQIWYPANSTVKGKLAPYIADAAPFASGFDRVMKIPEKIFTGLDMVKTHAIEYAKLSDTDSKYPVLVFSHGYTGYKGQNTFQVEQLVSHGYIVVGIDHTYSSIASVFPDGHVANFDGEGAEGYEQMKYSFMDKRNEVWVEDAKFVVDQIEMLSSNDPDGVFTGRMDLENLGMFGHSFGGATSVQMIMEDPRIKAGMNMDGALYGKLRIPADGLKKPFLMMSADDTVKSIDKISDEVIATMGTNREELAKYYAEFIARYDPITVGGNYWMTLKNNKHMSFSDMYLFTPLLEKMSELDVRSAHRLINDYTLEFFDHYLKQEPIKLLDQNIGDHPDYTLKKG